MVIPPPSSPTFSSPLDPLYCVLPPQAYLTFSVVGGPFFFRFKGFVFSLKKLADRFSFLFNFPSFFYLQDFLLSLFTSVMSLTSRGYLKLFRSGTIAEFFSTSVGSLPVGTLARNVSLEMHPSDSRHFSFLKVR